MPVWKSNVNLVNRPRHPGRSTSNTGNSHKFHARHNARSQGRVQTSHRHSCGALLVRQELLVRPALFRQQTSHATHVEPAAPFLGIAEQQNKVGEIWHEEFVFGFLPIPSAVGNRLMFCILSKLFDFVLMTSLLSNLFQALLLHRLSVSHQFIPRKCHCIAC